MFLKYKLFIPLLVNMLFVIQFSMASTFVVYYQVQYAGLREFLPT